MFINLIKLICAYCNAKTYVVGRGLGYKTPSAFQKVISGQDIRLTVLLAICNALALQIVIQDKDGRTVANINDYYNHQTKQPPDHAND